MTARLLCVCLVAFLIAVSVQRNPQGKHGSLSKQSSKVEAAESSASSDGDGGILPTFFPFEASSLEPGEEDVSEVLGRADTGALEVFDTEEENTPTLLSDEVLARLLQSSEEEAQQAVGEDKEYEEEKEEEEVEEEKEAAKGGDQQQERVEVRSSAAVEIPVDLDYNVDNEVTDASSTKLEGRDTWTSEAEGNEEVGEELPTAMADYDSQQSTAAKNHKEGSEEADQAVSTEVSEDEQEQRLWNTVKDKRSQPAEEEEGTSARRRRAKGRRRKTQHMKKVQNLQSGQASKGRARRREKEPNNNFPMMHHAKIPMLDLKPEQFLATADLNPRTRTTARVRPGAGWQETTADPCENFPCKRGKACELNDEMEPRCVCQQLSHCPSENFPELHQVCGTDNQTYETSCQLFATKCYLEGTKKGPSLHLDYTGPCKLIPPCLHTELLQFPLRMRDWLKNVLLQLYEHDSITPGLLTDKQRVRVQKLHQSTSRLHAGDHHPIELLALDFEKNYKLYIYPVHWQFAQLDKDPMDRLLSHSELAPLRAPLVPMEHCTSVFFGACDTDRDGLLSLSEWCQCLGLQHEDMDVQLLF